MENKVSSITAGRDLYKTMCLAAFIMFLVALPTLIRFNGIFLTTDDYIEQQLPFIIHCKHLLSGRIPFWDWNTHLGSDFWASYSFYTLGSPFFWMLMPFPESALPYAMVLSIIAKHVTAAATSYCYLARFVKNSGTAVLGSLLYAFSSFTVINEHFNHFTDVIALFPLLLIGCETAFLPGNRKRYLFPLAVFLNAMTNYYFFWGSSVFLLLYILARFGLDAGFRKAIKVKTLLRVSFEYLTGVAMACVLWLPSILFQMDSPRTENLQISYHEIFNKFNGPLWNTLEVIRMLLMPAESPRFQVYSPLVARYHSAAAHLPVFGFVFTLLFCIRNFKSWITGLVLGCITITLVPYLNGVFTLYTNTWYKRWWYAFVLICVLATCLAFEDFAGRIKKAGRLRAPGPVASKACCSPMHPGRIFAACLLAIAAIVLPQLYLLHMARNNRLDILGDAELERFFINALKNPYYTVKGTRILSAALTLTNYAALACILYFQKLRKYVLPLVSAVILVNYISFIQFNDHAVINFPVHENTKPFSLEYRASQVFDENRPEYRGSSYQYRIDSPSFVKNYSLYINRPSITSFNSVKCLSAKFLELAGFGEEHTVMSIPPEHNAALRALLSVKYYIQYDNKGISFDVPEGFEKYSENGNITLWENNNYLPFGFTYDAYALSTEVKLNAGNIAETMLQTVILESEEQAERLGYLYKGAYQPELSWTDAVRERRKTVCYDFTGDASGFRAKINTGKPELVFFSVPYGRGWSCEINRHPVPIEQVNISFMAVTVPAGESEIVFSYVTPGIKAGLLVSLAAILLYLLYCIAYGRKAPKPESGILPDNTAK